MPGGVPAARPLDLDDISAKIGQYLCAPRPGQHPAEIKNAYVRQRAHGSAGKCLKTGLGAPQNQRVNVVRPFVSIDRFQIHHVANYVVLIRNPVAAMHVPRCSRNLERLAAVIALEQRDRLRGSAPFIKQASESKTSVGTECDFLSLIHI